MNYFSPFPQSSQANTIVMYVEAVVGFELQKFNDNLEKSKS